MKKILNERGYLLLELDDDFPTPIYPHIKIDKISKKGIVQTSQQSSVLVPLTFGDLERNNLVIISQELQKGQIWTKGIKVMHSICPLNAIPLNAKVLQQLPAHVKIFYDMSNKTIVMIGKTVHPTFKKVYKLDKPLIL